MGAGVLAADLEGKVLHLNPAGARILELETPETVSGWALSMVMPLAEHDWGLLLSRARTRTLGRVEGHLRSRAPGSGSPWPPGERARDACRLRRQLPDLSEVEIELERRRLQRRMRGGEMAARMRTR